MGGRKAPFFMPGFLPPGLVLGVACHTLHK